MPEFVCAFCVGNCLHLLCFGVIRLIKVEDTPSVPKESPLGHILVKWAKHSHEPMTKKDMICYYNTVWAQKILNTREIKLNELQIHVNWEIFSIKLILGINVCLLT